MLSLLNTQVLSHNIKTDGNVGVTFHIEPDHSPQAQQPSQAWFVLTRKGGDIISLSECDCQLNIYSQSDNSQLVPKPTLKPISPEQYQNIPGADIVFPKAGIYDLELAGKPNDNNSFKPFSVNYSVTVSPSIIRETPTPENNIISSTENLDTPSNSTTSNGLSFPLISTLVGIGLMGFLGGFWWLKNKQKT